MWLFTGGSSICAATSMTNLELHKLDFPRIASHCRTNQRDTSYTRSAVLPLAELCPQRRTMKRKTLEDNIYSEYIDGICMSNMLIRDLKKKTWGQRMDQTTKYIDQNRIRIAWRRLNTNRVCPTCAQSLTIAAWGTGGARVCWRHCIASSSAFLSPITCNMPTSNRMLLPFGSPTICTICRWLTYWNRLRARTFPCHMRWPELWLLPILPSINARCRSIAWIAATASWSPKWCQHGRPKGWKFGHNTTPATRPDSHWRQLVEATAGW